MNKFRRKLLLARYKLTVEVLRNVVESGAISDEEVQLKEATRDCEIALIAVLENRHMQLLSNSIAPVEWLIESSSVPC